MDIFKTLDMAIIDELTAKIEKLEAQARKSICQSCVSMTNQAHNQDCIIEELEETIETLKLKVDYLQKSLDSSNGDTKALQKFLKSVGKDSAYHQLLKISKQAE